MPNLDSASHAFQETGPEDIQSYDMSIDHYATSVDENLTVHDTTHYSRLGVVWENTCLEDVFPPIDGAVDGDDEADSLSISGRISNLRDGVIVAVNQTTNKTFMTDVDGDGNYHLDSLSAGDYLLQAIPHPNNEEGLLPTVYYNHRHFTDGHNLTLEGDIYYADFSLLTTPSATTGNSSVSGRVVYGDPAHTDDDTPWEQNRFDHTVTIDDELPSDKNPGKGVPLFLVDELGETIAFTLSDNDGYFAFENLPEGEYIIEAAREGYSLQYQENIALSANQEMTVFAELIIGIPTSIAPSDREEVPVAYPNPFSTHLNIDHVKPGDEVVVFGVDGKVLFSTEANNTTVNLNTEDWPNGVYLVKVGGQGFKVVK